MKDCSLLSHKALVSLSVVSLGRNSMTGLRWLNSSLFLFETLNISGGTAQDMPANDGGYGKFNGEDDTCSKAHDESDNFSDIDDAEVNS